MNKDIKDYTVCELKAAAYDFLALIELNQKNLNFMNNELNERAKQPAEEIKQEEVKVEKVKGK